MRTTATLLAVLVAAVSRPALAWGEKGREIIAAIARDRLTPQAKAWVDAFSRRIPTRLRRRT